MKKDSKIFNCILLIAFCLCSLFLFSNDSQAAENDEAYLSKLIVRNVQSEPKTYNEDGSVKTWAYNPVGENLIDFDREVKEYSIIVPSDIADPDGARGFINVGAELPEGTSEDNIVNIAYNYRLIINDNFSMAFNASFKFSIVDNTSFSIFNNINEGSMFTVKLDGSEEEYSFYVHKQGTKSAILTSKIQALPEEISLLNKEEVTSAYEVYAELTEEQMGYMAPSLIQKLNESKEKIDELMVAKESEDKAAAKKVIEAIKAINPDKASIEEMKKVQSAYNSLTKDQKALVDSDTVAFAGKKAIDTKIAEIEKAGQSINEITPVRPTVAVNNGTSFSLKGYKYKVTNNFVDNPTVTVIGYKNKKLTKIVVPSTVSYKKVNFKVTAIDNNAFKGQKKATSVVIGKNVKTIGSKAFANGTKIKKITVKSTVLSKIGTKAFSGIYKKAVIKVPAKQLKSYKKIMKNKGQKKTVKITK